MANQILPQSAPTRNQLLYILRSSAKNLIKVGISYDPEQRLRSLVTGHPYELEVAYVVEFEENLAESVEKITKAILDYRKTKERGEWFDISVDGAVEAIKKAREVHEFCRKRVPKVVVEVDRELIREVAVEVPVLPPLFDHIDYVLRRNMRKFSASLVAAFPFIMVIIVPMAWLSTDWSNKTADRTTIYCLSVIFLICLSVLASAALSGRARKSYADAIRDLYRAP